MPPLVASCVFVLVIVGLFLLDRTKGLHLSKALLLPLIWIWLTSSRSVTEWVAIAGFGHPSESSQAAMYMEGTPLDRDVLSVLMILGLVVLLIRGRIGKLIQANIPIVLFLLFAALSVLWSDSPDITIRRWFRAVGCLVMAMVVLTERDREAATRRLFVWAGFLLIPHSILLIKYYPAIGRAYNHWTWQMSVIGVTTHKNSLGGICQVYGVVFAWHFLAAYRNLQLPRRMFHMVAHAAGLAMVVWLLKEANSVTGQSCFLLATLLIIVATTRTFIQKRWRIHLLVAALVVVPFAALFLGMGGSAIQEMGRDSTLTGRTNIWPRVIALVENPILGTGFESFWLGKRLQTMQVYQLGLNEAHNGYLEIWITLGWIGVLILAILIFQGYRNIITSYNLDPVAGSFRMAIFLTVIVSSFTEAALRTSSLSWMAFLLITMASPAEPLHQEVGRPQMMKSTLAQTRSLPVGIGENLWKPSPLSETAAIPKTLKR